MDWIKINSDTPLPKQSLWLYREHYYSSYPKSKKLAIYHEDIGVYLIEKDEYSETDIKDMFDYYKILYEPEDP